MPDRSRGRPAVSSRLIAASVACVMGLAGCATQASRREADLTSLQGALPGRYSTPPGSAAGAAAVPAGESAAASRPAGPLSAHLPVTLSIVKLQSANVIGDNVFFVRETPADNGRLVLAENIWKFTIDPRRGIVQQSFLFKHPQRWVGAVQYPGSLVALLPDDLVPMAGCSLAWTRTPTGFEASALSDDCRPGAGAAGLWIERHARLSGGQLSLTERHAGADGTLDARGGSLTLTLARAHGSAHR